MSEDKSNEILVAADCITIEATDRTTGKTVRRQLNCKYAETQYMYSLFGENEFSEPQNIIIITETGKQKLEEINRQRMGIPLLH